LNALPGRLQLATGSLDHRTQCFLFANQAIELLLNLVGAERIPLGTEAFEIPLDALNLRGGLRDPRLLDFGLPIDFRKRIRDPGPVRAPAFDRVFSVLQCVFRGAQTRVGALELRIQLAQKPVELLDLALIALDMRLKLIEMLFGRLQVLALPLSKLLTVLNRLLEPGNFGADFVIVTLYGVELVVTIGQGDPQFFN
jgi:hypothetical protein